jgi:ABC-2 type transport system ATP-binding protein
METNGATLTSAPPVSQPARATTPPSAISVRGVRKSYGSIHALNGVDLEVRTGEVFALLGPNGAGKTTMCEILEGHRDRDAGQVSVLGFDPARGEQAFRDRIGIVLQEGQHSPTTTVIEAVRAYSAPYPHPRDPDEVLQMVGLADKAKARIKSLSGGQRRRLDLAIGIAGDPELIFLDEPTTGFDPSARRRSWELVRSLRTLGTTILLTTHYMDEAQNLADRVAVISAGRIVAEGPPETIGGRDLGRVTVAFRLPDDLSSTGVPLPAGVEPDPATRTVRFETASPTRALAPVMAWAAGRGVELDGLSVTRPTLEDMYLELTDEEESR